MRRPYYMKFSRLPFVSNSMYAVLDMPASQTQDFAEVYKTHHRRILSLCRYLLNSTEAAEDAAHEVFLRAQRKLSTYDTSMPLSSWLLGIASHHCIDLLRRRGIETRIFETDAGGAFDPASQGPGPLSEMLAAERGNAVRSALSELQEKFRVPLVLAYYNELSYDEIANLLGLKRNNVATLIFRAKQQLRQKLSLKGERA